MTSPAAAPRPAGDDRKRPLALVAAGVLIALGVSASAGRGTGAEGAPSSSFSAGATGLAAYAELLERYGHPVTRLRGEITGLDPAATMVVLDAPSVSTAEATRLGRFVRQGGRLIAGGFGAGEWLPAVVRDAPDVVTEEGSEHAVPEGNAGEVGAIRAVRLAGVASFGDTGGMRPLLRERGGERLVAVVASPGRGRVVALADASVLQNRFLGLDDNAGFGLAVAGEDGRPVVFAEGPHGYGRAEGMAAIPARWRLALAGLTLATLVWLAARARRFGPPEDEARPLGPPRRAYVDALAGTLARTGAPQQAARPVWERARALVAERAALPPGAGDDDLRAAALRLGLTAEEADALAGPVIAGRGGDRAHATVLAIGRALTRLHGEKARA